MRLRRGLFLVLAVGGADVVDELGLSAHAAIGESGVCSSDVHWCHFIGAESDSWRGANVVAESHLARDLHDAAVTDQFGDFYRGDVERVSEGFADSYATHKFCA